MSNKSKVKVEKKDSQINKTVQARKPTHLEEKTQVLFFIGEIIMLFL